MAMVNVTTETCNMKKHFVYDPQPNATPDEVLQTLKMFTVMSMPHTFQAEMYEIVYDKLPENAKRHFKIKEEK